MYYPTVFVIVWIIAVTEFCVVVLAVREVLPALMTGAAMKSEHAVGADASISLLLLEKELSKGADSHMKVQHVAVRTRKARQLYFTWPYFGLYKRYTNVFNPYYYNCYYPGYLNYNSAYGTANNYNNLFYSYWG